MSRRLAFLSVLALLLAPLLAGCAVDQGKPREIKLTLKLGTLMPMSGELRDDGPGMQNGARLAIKLVNDANVGLRIEATHEDGTTSDRAAVTNAFGRMTAGNGATAIVGPCCTDLTTTVVDLAKQKRVLVVAPSLINASTADLLWRVTPSDALQGRVLAGVVTRAGVSSVSLVMANGSYATGLEREFRAAFTGSIVAAVRYDETSSTNMMGPAAQVCAPPAAGGIVILGDAREAAALVRALHERDCLSKVKVFASDHARAPLLITGADKDAAGRWLAAGVQGTSLGSPESFSAVYRVEFNTEPTRDAAESFDAVMQIALAAVAAGSVDGKAMSDAMLRVVNAPGAKYRGEHFAAAAAALLSGDDIDYHGYAHDFQYDATRHEPASGAFDVWRVSSDGTLETIERGVTA